MLDTNKEGKEKLTECDNSPFHKHLMVTIEEILDDSMFFSPLSCVGSNLYAMGTVFVRDNVPVVEKKEDLFDGWLRYPHCKIVADQFR